MGPWRNASLEFYEQHHFTTAGLPTGALYEAYARGQPEERRLRQRGLVGGQRGRGVLRSLRARRAGAPALAELQHARELRGRSEAPRVAAVRGDLHARRRGTLAALARAAVRKLRPSSRLGFELGTRYQYNRDNTQWVANVGDVGADTTHYLFGRLHQDLLSFTGRMDLTIRPTMSLQLYAEPFVTAGHFTGVRELASPRARSYDARFRPYAGPPPDADFNEKSFHSSVVARWEYRPGSTLFVVWTQGRDQCDRDAGTFAASRDYRNLFAARPDNVVPDQGGVLDGTVSDARGARARLDGSTVQIGSSVHRLTVDGRPREAPASRGRPSTVKPSNREP